MKRFGRSGLGVVLRADVLVLETTGRRTGKRRETPLAYVEHEGGWLVAGGAGGQATVDWVANLVADSRATVTIERRQGEVVAVRLSGAEYASARDLALRTWPRVRAYERRSGRPVPLFLLRPVDA